MQPDDEIIIPQESRGKPISVTLTISIRTNRICLCQLILAILVTQRTIQNPLSQLWPMWTYGPANVLRPRKFLPDQIMRGGNGEPNPDDKTSSERSDSIVPEVSESENDEMIVENEKPREENTTYDLITTLNFTDEYSHLYLLPVRS